MAMFLTTFALIVAGSVLAVFFYIGSVSATNNGWNDLAGRFRHRNKVKGKTLKFVSATLNEVFLQNMLHVTPVAEGLVLCGVLPFRPSHPQILLPWDQLESAAFHDDRGHGYRLRIAEFPSMKLEWQQRTHERLLATVPQDWPSAREALVDPGKEV